MPTKTIKGPQELAPKPLAKADSGYSSNVSLRSFRKDSTATAPAEEPPPTPPKDTLRVASSTYSEGSRVSSSTYSVASAASDMTIRAKRSLPTLPLQEQVPEQPLRQPPPVPSKHAMSHKSSRDFPAVAQKPDLTHPSALSPHLVVPAQESRRKSVPSIPRGREESPASDSVSSTSSRWTTKKLNKRPQSLQPEPVYTVQAFRSPSEQLRIPAPSVEARRKLEKRVDNFPVTAIPNTYVGQLELRRSSSKETLGTIFSVGSTEVREELSFARLQSSLPPVPTQPSIPEHSSTNSFRKGGFSARESHQRPSSYDNELPDLPVQRSQDFPTSSLTSRSEFNRRYTYQAPLPTLPPRDEWIRKSMDRVARDFPPPRMRTQHDFESHVTSFDSISNSLGRSPYDAALAPPRPSAGFKAQERAKSMTAQFEADAAARFARQRTFSEESDATVVRSRKSYDSIANRNPYLEPEVRNERIRQRPPQAHAKFNGSATKGRPSPSLKSSSSSSRREPSPVNGHVSEQYGGWAQTQDGDEERRFSTLSSLSKKARSPPPVSMTTQRKMVPPSRTPPAPTQAPDRAAPQPPAKLSPKELNDTEAPEWAKPANFWAERRKSAGEVLKVQTRKSMEMQRSERRPDLRSRKSMDAQTYRDTMGERGASRQTLKSSYNSFDTSQGRKQGWNVGVGYETSTHNSLYDSQPPPSWVDATVRTTAPHRSGEYDHTYGSSSNSEKENMQHEYYDSPNSSQQEHLPGTSHKSVTSTSEMLVLDRYSGGLDYGYEAGYGLGGSAGTRNTGKLAAGSRKSVPVSSRYGVDFSDVPVIVQRVHVQG